MVGVSAENPAVSLGAGGSGEGGGVSRDWRRRLIKSGGHISSHFSAVLFSALPGCLF